MIYYEIFSCPTDDLYFVSVICDNWFDLDLNMVKEEYLCNGQRGVSV